MVPNRRSVLRAFAGGVVAGLAGCGSGGEGQLTTLSEPDRPEGLRADAVKKYVRKYERMLLYNNLHEPDATEIEVSSKAAIDSQTDNGIFAFASASGYVKADDAVGEAGGGTLGAYFVDTETTLRLGTNIKKRRQADAYAAEVIGENIDDPEYARGGFRIYNFDSDAQQVSVAVTYLDTDEPEQAFSSAYDLQSESAIWQQGVAVRRGTYRIAAQLDPETTANARWTIADDATFQWAPMVVRISSDGDLTVHRSSIEEIKY